MYARLYTAPVIRHELDNTDTHLPLSVHDVACLGYAMVPGTCVWVHASHMQCIGVAKFGRSSAGHVSAGGCELSKLQYKQVRLDPFPHVRVTMSCVSHLYHCCMQEAVAPSSKFPNAWTPPPPNTTTTKPGTRISLQHFALADLTVFSVRSCHPSSCWRHGSRQGP